MDVVYIITFFILILFSAFFSSAETSLLSLNKIKLNMKAKKRSKRAQLLKGILAKPDEFFSTILIGNNFVNIAAASISTVVFNHLLAGNEELYLLVSTLVTSVVVLIFAEIIPKSYAFRHSEKMSFLYAYPIRFFSYLLYPFVKVTSLISRVLFRKSAEAAEKKDFTREEVKHFLTHEVRFFRYNPETLRMVNEIIDIVEKDIKSIMTPRVNLVALEDNESTDALKRIILEKKISKVPVYKDNLDNITGIINARSLLPVLLTGNFSRLSLKDIAVKPIFISEYSSLVYVLKEFKRRHMDIAVVLDEYGSTIGILTLNDIFREILGEIKFNSPDVRKLAENHYVVRGSLPVEEVNDRLNIHLPDKKDYTTLSGLFIYYYGKLPRANASVRLKDIKLTVKRMGKRKIDEVSISLPKQSQV